MVLLYSSHASCGPELLAVQLLRQGLRFCMTVPTAQHQPPVSVPPRGRTLSAERRIWRLCVLRARLSANGRRPGRPRGKHCSAPFRTDAAPSADRPMHSTHAQDACVGNVDFRKGPGTARLAQTCARAQHQPFAPFPPCILAAGRCLVAFFHFGSSSLERSTTVQIPNGPEHPPGRTVAACAKRQPVEVNFRRRQNCPTRGVPGREAAVAVESVSGWRAGHVGPAPPVRRAAP
jgi:hypothetical protein